MLRALRSRLSSGARAESVAEERDGTVERVAAVARPLRQRPRGFREQVGEMQQRRIRIRDYFYERR